MQGAGLREGLLIARYVQYTGIIRYSSPALPTCMKGICNAPLDGMRVQNAMLCYAMLHMMRVAGAHGSV